MHGLLSVICFSISAHGLNTERTQVVKIVEKQVNSKKLCKVILIGNNIEERS